MQFRPPKNDAKYLWTQHVIGKMMHYGISESLIKRITRFPDRREEGIAPKTTAAMKPTSSKKQEVWVMYTEMGTKKKIISAWRYPGVSPLGRKIPIPDEILQELEGVLE
ncbi:MAG: hypothetical protein AAB483_00180 [Patescibacteria group bacterium]